MPRGRQIPRRQPSTSTIAAWRSLKIVAGCIAVNQQAVAKRQNRIRPCSQAEFAVRKKKEPHRCKTVRFTRFVSHYGRCPKAAASAALGQPTYATLHRFTSSLGKTSRVTRDPPVANTDTPSVAGLGPLPSATADEPDKALARDVAHLVTVFPAPLLGGLCRGTRTADAQDHASVDYTHCIGRNASKRLRKWQMTG